MTESNATTIDCTRPAADESVLARHVAVPVVQCRHETNQLRMSNFVQKLVSTYDCLQMPHCKPAATRVTQPSVQGQINTPASSSALLEFSQDLAPLSAAPTFCMPLCITPSATLEFNTVEFSISSGRIASLSAPPATEREPAASVPLAADVFTGVLSALEALLSSPDAAVTAPVTADELAVLLIALVALLRRPDAAETASVTADVFVVLLIALVALLSSPEAADEAAVTAPAAEEAAPERKSRVVLTAELFTED